MLRPVFLRRSALALSAALASALLLGGCAAPPNPAAPHDPIQFAGSWQRADAGAFGDAEPLSADYGSRRELRAAWCSSGREESFETAMTTLCGTLGGEMRDGWCTDVRTGIFPLFYAAETEAEGATCSGKTHAAAIIVAAPAADATEKDLRWMRFAKAKGFRPVNAAEPESDAEAAQIEAAREARDRREREEAALLAAMREAASDALSTASSREQLQYSIEASHGMRAGGRPDMAEAVKWAKTAAEREDAVPEAWAWYGYVLSTPRFEALDYAQAIRYFERAERAELATGFADAGLGSIYANPQSGFYDLKKAAFYYKRALSDASILDPAMRRKVEESLSQLSAEATVKASSPTGSRS